MNEQNTDNFSPHSDKHKEIIVTLAELLALMTERLLSLCRTTEVPEDEYTVAAKGAVETVVTLVGSRLRGALTACEEHYTALRQKLNEANAQQTGLIDGLRDVLEQAKEDPIIKIIIYVLLAIGMVLVFATALQIVQPEMPWWVTPFQAVVVIGSSLFGCFLYKQVQQKSRFCKWLAIIGIVLIALTSVSCAISKGLFYHQAGSGTFITGTGTTRQDKVQLFFSISTFVTLVLAEFALATLLAIQIVTARESQKPLECAKEELNIVSDRITQLVRDMVDLAQYISAVNAFDNIAVTWKTQALIVLIRECRAAQEEFGGIHLSGEFLNIQ